jgi:hypothetical protein
VLYPSYRPDCILENYDTLISVNAGWFSICIGNKSIIKSITNERVYDEQYID